MPAFPLVDAHVHLWDPSRLRYPWLAGVPPLNRRHAPAELRAACGPVEVGKLVFVECGCDRAQSFAEAEWVSDLAATEPRLRGIVAHVSLEKGDAADSDLASHAFTAAPKPYHPGSISRHCAQLNTHGMARRSSMPWRRERDAGRLPMFRVAISSSTEIGRAHV